ALARKVGDDQAALVQHADQSAELFERNLLRGKLLFEASAQLVETGHAVKPVQQGKLFLLKTEVVQADRVFNNPILPTQISLLGDLQVRAFANCKRASGTGDEAVG